MAWLSTFQLLGEKEWLPQHDSAFSGSLSYVLLTVFVTAAAYSWTTLNSPMRKLPIINPPKFFSASEARVSIQFNVVQDCKKYRKELT